MAAVGEGREMGNRLKVRDRISGVSFLIDSGADISLLPVGDKTKRKPADFRLYAANDSRVDTYGEKRCVLNLGLRREISWNFCIADVPYPIIGADILAHYGLVVDLRRRRLVDTLTSVYSLGVRGHSSFPAVSLLCRSAECKYTRILADYTEITGMSQQGAWESCDVVHHIQTTGPPVAERPRRLSPAKLAAAKREFRAMCRAGICRPSRSPWASPIHLEPKGEGEWRICGDYRRLNFVTIPDRYPVPHLQDFTANLHGKKIFSALDLHKAFHQIPLAPSDIEKTAVITPFGLFEFKVMTFGLRNAGQTFQRYIHRALADLDFVFAFLDDILVASSSPEEHEEHLRVVFERLKQFHLRLNVNKCRLGLPEIQFLGYIVGRDGIRPTPDKVEAIVNFPRPRTVEELRRFLGAVNFYRRSIPHAAEAQAPLNEYLRESRKKDKREVAWSPEAVRAFEGIRTEIARAALLAHPCNGAETRVVTDASDFAMGAVLEQRIEGSWRPLSFFSRRFSPPQLKYSAYDRELTAIFEAIKYFKYFLDGRDFVVVTDHKPLIYAFMQRADKASPRQVRQLSFIAQYTTRIEYLPGAENVVADPLSRIEAIRLPCDIELNELAAAQDCDDELKKIRASKEVPCSMKQIQWGPSHTTLACEISGEAIRPYIPLALRRRVFDLFHSSAHPGAKTTDRLIRQRYMWPNMCRDVKEWCNKCVQCQQSKVSRHVQQLPAQFVAPDARFDHVHMDIVGPLCEDSGFKYLLTMIDRFSRWPEAVPLKDIEARTVARAFFDNWISRFGAPKILTTDQGAQFESKLFDALLSLIGCHRIRTTAYHPAANGLVERWHRTLKAALMCHTERDWSRSLSTVLLGLRNQVRLDTNASPSEYVYGTTMRIPGEFFLPEDFTPEPRPFLEEFREFMRQIRPVPVALKYKKRAFFFSDLSSCSHVFLRTGAVRKPLERPYTGPHKVLSRESDRVYTIEVNGAPRSVSTENIKPAYFVPEDIAGNTSKGTSGPSNGTGDQRPTLKTYARKKVAFSPPTGV